MSLEDALTEEEPPGPIESKEGEMQRTVMCHTWNQSAAVVPGRGQVGLDGAQAEQGRGNPRAGGLEPPRMEKAQPLWAPAPLLEHPHGEEVPPCIQS